MKYSWCTLKDRKYLLPKCLSYCTFCLNIWYSHAEDESFHSGVANVYGCILAIIFKNFDATF